MREGDTIGSPDAWVSGVPTTWAYGRIHLVELPSADRRSILCRRINEKAFAARTRHANGSYSLTTASELS